VLLVFGRFDFLVDFSVASFCLRSDFSARILDLDVWSVLCLSLVAVVFEFPSRFSGLIFFVVFRSHSIAHVIVTPRCYCSSYSISTVASTIFIQLWLQYKPNSMKMVFSTNGVGSF
jgi:hypothetical protein